MLSERSRLSITPFFSMHIYATRPIYGLDLLCPTPLPGASHALATDGLIGTNSNARQVEIDTHIDL